MNDPGLQNLLKWGIQNSEASRADPSAQQQPPQQLDFEALQRFMGGGKKQKSDAELMEDSMAVIKNEEATLEHRIVAFENLEMLIQNLDNANTMASIGNLWSDLINLLQHDIADLRMNAALCCSVAVQNNLKTQERLLIMGAIPTLVKMATTDTEKAVRKKAILALSSGIRNFQPGVDAAVPHLPDEFQPQGKIDANDMESVDSIINKLRQSL
ncbi:Fes1-domain-containing protein [Pyrenochaeta sp. DS3sAY3a]|nr:Fes1-domain-containing protein [Pyrenochaeta sp. DS3sAY3a]